MGGGGDLVVEHSGGSAVVERGAVWELRLLAVAPVLLGGPGRFDFQAQGETKHARSIPTSS